MELLVFDDVGRFSATAFPFLEQREAENGLMLGLASRAVSQPPPTLFMGVVVEDDRVVMAGLVSGQSLILTRLYPGAVELLVEDLTSRMPLLPGVLGPVDAAEEFSKLWIAATGGKLRNVIRHGIYSCSQVIPPRPCEGGCRLSGRQDVDLVVRWLTAFHQEALPHEPLTADKARALAEARVESGMLFFWDVDGECRSMAGLGRPTQNTITVTAVYTPPEFRNRGYAASLVSAITQDAFDGPYREVVLYTNQSNPAANWVYQKIGYQAVADSIHHSFDIR